MPPNGDRRANRRRPRLNCARSWPKPFAILNPRQSARRKRPRLKAAYLIPECKNPLLEDLPPRLPPSRSFDTSGLGVPSAPGPFLRERRPKRYWFHPREHRACRRIINHRDQRDLRNNTMKRLLLIGVTACTFALSLILSASAMPSANPNALIGTDTPIIQVHGWGHHGGRGHHYGWGRGHHYGWGHHHRW